MAKDIMVILEKAIEAREARGARMQEKNRARLLKNRRKLIRALARDHVRGSVKLLDNYGELTCTVEYNGKEYKIADCWDNPGDGEDFLKELNLKGVRFERNGCEFNW